MLQHIQSLNKDDLLQSLEICKEELEDVANVLELMQNPTFNTLLGRITDSFPKEMLANVMDYKSEQTETQLEDAIAASRGITNMMSKYTVGTKEALEESIHNIEDRLRRLP